MQTLFHGKMRKLLLAVPFLLLLGIWLAAWRSAGSVLVPSPGATAAELWKMCLEKDTWLDVAFTFQRGLLGLILAAAAALFLGIGCGLRPTFMNLMSPLVATVQSCPPIVWISLLMVWAGVGNVIPVIVVFASAFPVLFINIAGGTSQLDKNLLEMAKLYKVPRVRILRRLILPGIRGNIKSGLSFAAGITWKVTATAEFFGSMNGIGAKIQLAFQQLNMPRLFALTALIAALGITLDLILKYWRTSDKRAA